MSIRRSHEHKPQAGIGLKEKNNPLAGSLNPGVLTRTIKQTNCFRCVLGWYPSSSQEKKES